MVRSIFAVVEDMHLGLEGTTTVAEAVGLARGSTNVCFGGKELKVCFDPEFEVMVCRYPSLSNSRVYAFHGSPCTVDFALDIQSVDVLCGVTEAPKPNYLRI